VLTKPPFHSLARCFCRSSYWYRHHRGRKLGGAGSRQLWLLADVYITNRGQTGPSEPI